MDELKDKFLACDHHQRHFANETATRLVYAKHVRAGDVALDCGANLGHHTSVLSGLVGEGGAVHAFEPNPAHYVTLLGLGGNVRLWPFAVGDELAVKVLHIPEGLDGWASLENLEGVLQDRRFVERTTVQVRIDDLPEIGGRPVRFIKVDVERREFEALNGMLALLRRDRPLVILENASRRIVEQFATVDYGVYDFFGAAWTEGEEALPNMVARPREIAGDALATYGLTVQELSDLHAVAAAHTN